MDKDKSVKVNAKEELISNIREWLSVDKDLKKLKAEVKTKTIIKKRLAENLANVMKNNSIDCFDVNGGSIVYKQTKIKKTISCKFLLNQLQLYYKNNPEIAQDITTCILDNREEIIKDEIKYK